MRKVRGKTKRNGIVESVRLIQLSTVGEVFLEGEQPSESPSADGEIPCAMLLAHGAGG
ncbi:MAG: hypothetical protein U0L99_03945 [Ruminococcus sp.]|nr:hypothetical protein [Ruminococcus sp.]